MRIRKSWREKLGRQQEPPVVDLPPGYRHGVGRMLIPTPRQVDALVRKVPEGWLVTPEQLRVALARTHDAGFTCPLCTGIFLRVAAEAAAEDERAGHAPVTPFWRVVTAAGALNPKFPGGSADQARRLEAEGHTLEPAAGKRPPKVREFEQRLVEM